MKVAVIDLDSVAYAIGNGNKVLDEAGNPLKVDGKFVYTPKTEDELKYWTDFYMRAMLDTGGFTHYIAYIKGKGTTLRRLAVNPDYKGQRGKVAPEWWQIVKDYLISRWAAIEASGHEVDDYVNVTRLMVKDSHIVAIDGDLLGLAGEHFNWRTQTWVTTTWKQSIRKFWTDMIAGQTVDNVKGIPGKGPAYANMLFEDLTDPIEFRSKTINAYVHELGDIEGIEAFYKNYMCLKLLDEIPGFIAPQPIEYKKVNVLEL